RTVSHMEMTTALAIFGIANSPIGKEGAGLARDLLGRMLGPSFDAMGNVLADPIKNFHRQRVERAEFVVIEAASKAIEEGGALHPVPGRILWPILEKSSLEEDDSLRRKWIGLLANATRNPESSSPAFAAVLAELGPLEARILDARGTIV